MSELMVLRESITSSGRNVTLGLGDTEAGTVRVTVAAGAAPDAVLAAQAVSGRQASRTTAETAERTIPPQKQRELVETL
jgi:hypothetical protein